MIRSRPLKKSDADITPFDFNSVKYNIRFKSSLTEIRYYRANNIDDINTIRDYSTIYPGNDGYFRINNIWNGNRYIVLMNDKNEIIHIIK